MARITIEYDGRNALAQKALDFILSLGVFKVKSEESPYDPEFVAKIERSRKSKGKKINVEDLWK
ncbi:hypothetical protein LJC68_07105 [Bacteroidales bacterium OttesenSCG-928-B11]|nr:hypothetical protein [Bacteroidales bacterium OttesenSCG-928-C03]MDL2312627.1 hypothetical protein [Bacteroidales bacterium OttesenSCG-928-B11]